MKKRILSTLIALAMVLTLMPGVVFAYNADNKTIGDILPTGFPTEVSTAWVCQTDRTNLIFKDESNSKLIIGTVNSGSFNAEDSFDCYVDSLLTWKQDDDGYYALEIEDQEMMKFIMYNGVLTSIILGDYYSGYGGTYSPVTIGDILPENFPDSDDNGWYNSTLPNLCVYKDDTNLIFYNTEVTVSLSSPLERVKVTGESDITYTFKYVDVGESETMLQFNMSGEYGDVLENIVVLEYYTAIAGTYEPPKFTVLYDANGATSGSVPSDNNEYASGTPVTVLGNTGTLAKTGYTFDGWNTNAAGTGIGYKAEDTFSITADAKLFAKWVSVSQTTATFDKQNGTGGTDSVLVDYQTSNPDITVPSRIGYVFQGYYTEQNGAGTKYWNADGTGASEWLLTGSQTVYAYWKPDAGNGPSANTGLVYTGKEQTGVAAGAGYTLTSNSAINAGNYTAKATLAEGYVWSDGSTDAKDISWSIGKADMEFGINCLPPCVPYFPLEFDGQEQQLLNSGLTFDEKDNSEFGTFYYSVDGSDWSTDLPMAREVGEYNPLWYFVGGDNHNNVGSKEEPIEQLYPVVISSSGLLTLSSIADQVYTGSEITPLVTISGLIAGEELILNTDYTVSYTNNINVGTATATVTLLNTDKAKNYGFDEGVNKVTFTIAKKAVTITAKDKSAYVGDTAPRLGENDYKVVGLVGGDTLITKPTLSYATPTDMTKAGSVAINISGADAGSNYSITYVDGTLTISNRPSSGGGSSSTVTVPVSGDENSVKVSATVSGSTATVQKINDADLEKVTEGESVSIDLSNAGKNVDTAKIPTQTVEKIAEKSSMTVKLPVATVEFDKTATEEIADQAKGTNIELVIDDIKEVSLNAVQKEAVGKLDTAVIIDAHLTSGGSRLCTEEGGGFGGGKAKIVLPYEIKNNRKPENYSIFYVNEAGRLEKINAVYDEELKAFVFEIEHFSVYAVAYDEYVMPFVDVAYADFFYDAVKWAAKNSITAGVDETHFDPNGITSRAQMVTFLWRAAGKPEPTITETPFTDLDSGAYYYKAVLWAYENDITDGTSETTFEPEKNVSRAQAVTFLWRYSGGLSVDYWMQMSDVASGEYYSEAVRWALSEKITEGTTTTTFSPNDDCLRGQIVTFLYRDFVK